MLPRVQINFQNGALKQITASADGVLGFVLSGTAVAGKFALSTAYTLYSLTDLDALGVTSDNNALIYKTIKEFYAEAGEGTEAWLMAFPNTMLPSAMLDVTQSNAKTLLAASNGRIKGLLVSRQPDVSYTPTITDGMDADVTLAIANAQALAVNATTVNYAPIFVIVEGYAYSGDPTDLTDLTMMTNNYVGVLIGDTVSGSKNAAVGIIGGRIAKIGVQENIGKVVTGALASITMFIGALPVEQADVESLNNKGFISFRTFTGRSGYFLTDDHLATADSDDYSHLTARRTGNKAYRILYNTSLDMLLQEFPVNADGTLQAAIAKSWETEYKQDIALQMTANGELSGVDGDNGVLVQVDTTNNVVSTSQVNVTARVRPFGYARYVNVNLGFTNISSN